jgi:ABC-type nitrate/sulfonate/bicarbonate transport system substrate-binding protein
MKAKKIVGMMMVLAVTFMVVTFSSQVGECKDLVKVTWSENSAAATAVVYVAWGKGFFKEEGLDVDLKPFTMGRLALDAVLGQRADICAMAETPPMLAAFHNQPIRLFTATEASENAMKVLVRKDKGVNKPSDLIGRRVACSIGTNSEYFMSVFLAAKGVDRNKVTVLNMSPGDMVTAINQGGVDAIFTWEPHVTNAINMLSTKGAVWYAGDVYTELTFIGANESYIQKNPEVIKGIIKALIKAEKFMKDNPEEAIKLTAPRVNMTADFVKSIWPAFNFHVSLEKKHLDQIINEGKWAKDVGIAPRGAALPDFKKLFYTEALKSIDPKRVGF